MAENYLENLLNDTGENKAIKRDDGPLGLIDKLVEKNWTKIEKEGENRYFSAQSPVNLKGKNNVNIVALGDVGLNVALGLTLLGGSVIGQLGLWDLNYDNLSRCTIELNQIGGLSSWEAPVIKAIDKNEIFSADVVVFCASLGVPAIGSNVKDVRMAQLDRNKALVREYGYLARKEQYKGLVAMVADPVDPLAYEMMTSGMLQPWQVKGYGLGVMNQRARYYGEKISELNSYLKGGRIYGPHGEDLVVVNSLDQDFSEDVSLRLKELTVTANHEVRKLGYKPYIAPAISSAAMAIIDTLQGKLQHSSVYVGTRKKGAFLGMSNKLEENRIQVDNSYLPDVAFQWVKESFDKLVELNVTGQDLECSE